MYLSLLVFIFINYYYIKHWIRKDYTLLYLYKMNKAKDIDIKNRTRHYFDDIININNHDLDLI